MFGIITDDDQVKNHQGAQFIGKSANLIGFGAELAKEVLQQVGGPDQQMQGMLEVVKGQAGVHILDQELHHTSACQPTIAKCNKVDP
jgi:hypothetical protein